MLCPFILQSLNEIINIHLCAYVEYLYLSTAKASSHSEMVETDISF